MRAVLSFLCGLLAAVPLVASAHAPVYLGDQDVVTIPDPNISRAYYGELMGKPAVFQIEIPYDTELYLNVLAPDTPSARTDFVVRVRNADGEEVIDLDSKSVWEKWYEEFAGDTYLKGPEIKKLLPRGEYTITVSSPDNEGKYVLAPGEAEVFNIVDVPYVIAEIYRIKTDYFGKEWYAIFEGIIGKTLLVALLILLVAPFLIFRFVLKKV